MSKKYTQRISEVQKQILVEYIASHKELISGLLTRTFTYAEKTRLWNEVTEILNSNGSGGAKTAEEWKSRWTDMKSAVKKKIQRQQDSIQRTGGGWFRANPLTELEEKIAGMMGQSTLHGIPGVPESDGFPLDLEENSLPPSSLVVSPSPNDGTYTVPPEATSVTLVVSNTEATSVAQGTCCQESFQDSRASGPESLMAVPSTSRENLGNTLDDAPAASTSHTDIRRRNLKRKAAELERTEIAVGTMVSAQEEQARALREIAETAKSQVAEHRRTNDLLQQLIGLLATKLQ